jgi:hypothetical protein
MQHQHFHGAKARAVNDRPPVGVFVPLPILWLASATRSSSENHPRFTTNQSWIEMRGG